MQVVEKLQAPENDAVTHARSYLRRLSQLLGELDLDEIARAAEAMWQAREDGRRIFFIGNGGSAATASHFANDIGLGTRNDGAPFRALSLTDNNAILTCISNDM